MTRFVLRLIPMLLLSCLSLSLAARTLGTIQPPNPALRGFVEGCEDKPQPCWYGIVPGVTTIEEAKIILASHDYWERPNYLLYDEGYEYINISEAPSCVTLVKYVGDTVLNGLRLGCLGIRLGDVISHWGTQMALGYGEIRTIDGLGYPGYSISLHRSNFQPYLLMHEISLKIPPIPPQNNDQNHFRVNRWRGFAPFWRYCQLNNMFVCPRTRRALFEPTSTTTPINSNSPTLPPPPKLPTLPPA